MKVINESQYPDDAVVACIEAGVGGIESAVEHVTIRVVDDTRGASGIAKFMQREIIVRIGPARTFPYTLYQWRKKHKKVDPADVAFGRMSNMPNFTQDRRTGDWYSFTYVKCGYGGLSSPVITMNNWREGLVALSAHEAFHFVQHARIRDARRAGSTNRLRYSEVECEKHADAILRQYRDRHLTAVAE